MPCAIMRRVALPQRTNSPVVSANDSDTDKIWDAVVIGAGIAGLSAGIYLGRAKRDALIISAGRSMAVWEPDVQNYLGFPEGVSGEDLITRGREQAGRYGVQFAEARITSVAGENGDFTLTAEPQDGNQAPRLYRARKV